MKLEILSRERIIEIYKEHLERDFPQDELRPLQMLLASYEKGEYECLVMMDDDARLVGYIYMIKHQQDYLVDYLAILPEFRNSGIGSIMLHLLGDYLSDATSIIGEVENPDFEENADEKVLQTRRRDFYFRNGFRDTGVRVECFGVPFIIIETGKNLMHSKKQVEQLYKMHYSKVLPKDLFEKNIVITGETL